MSRENARYKIKIVKDGPYIVSGNLPLHEKVIVPKNGEYAFEEGRPLPQAESYALCRCGKSKNPPFCDGAHTKSGFHGQETASTAPYAERAARLEGPGVDLLDDGRCAMARFCHTRDGDAWELTAYSRSDAARTQVIRAACDCPAGRLTAVGKGGTVYEPELEPSIDILQDPEKGVSGGIFVKGYVPVEAADGTVYEPRNRIVLCRCGASKNKPFCDAAHLLIKYLDK
ncbi:MAG TPA: CDGSH iron-sulfur domain-containing protein [Candidatus Acidoferrum sp.]|nr:CDGSH iron-sulfur domain-containing protein [Candidatus Acidoferrum sp.]